MKCYYEVLSVARDAEESEIKSSYKKLALKWHPDKNLDSPGEAKEQFQLVQQAYEVLSDRQERAWYDNHREQILRGSDKDFEDNSLDVFEYFTSSCFKGYGDDEKAFYTIYRKVFEDLAKEDLEYMDNKEEFCSIPMFGNSSSDYDGVVGPFYNYWLSYTTKKSYVWLDPYDLRETRERRVLKLIEKENKKVRVKAKKERNEEVRNLVMFVHKRDKRVQQHAKRVEAKSKENKLKQEEMSKKRRMERRKEIKESGSQAEWTKFDNVQLELKEIEKSLAEQFGEDLSGSDEGDSEEEQDENLYCVACNKIFKTPKAFQNHELSKKHKSNVDALKESMIEEDEEFGDSELEDDVETSEPEAIELSKPEDDNFKSSPVSLDGDVVKPSAAHSEEECSDESIEKSALKPNKQRKSKKVLCAESGDEVDVDINVNKVESEVEESEIDPSKKQKKKAKRKKKKAAELNSTSVVDANEEPEDVHHYKKNRKSKDKSKAGKRNGTVDDDADRDHCCMSCKSQFDSKNKLFEHLKKTGHSIYIPKTNSNIDMKKRSIK